MPDTIDNRFAVEGVDGRFSTAGMDWRFVDPGFDNRFPEPGVDRRWVGDPWGIPADYLVLIQELGSTAVFPPVEDKFDRSVNAGWPDAIMQ